MSKQPWIIVSAALAAAAPWACGGGSNGNTSSGNGGATSTSTSTTHTSSTVSTGMGGTGGMDCSGLLNPGACGDCISGSCCPQLTDCNNDQNCSDCLAGAGTSCDTDPLLMALVTCQNTSCSAQCTSAPPPCDPITNAGCDSSAGEACDFGADANGNSDFQCYPAPNTGTLCGACDGMSTFCEGGLTCNGDGLCAKFCCDDGDCAGSDGGTGVCVPTGLFGVGFCTTDMTGATTECDVPLVSPSGGSCVMGFGGTGGGDGGP